MVIKPSQNGYQALNDETQHGYRARDDESKMVVKQSQKQISSPR